VTQTQSCIDISAANLDASQWGAYAPSARVERLRGFSSAQIDRYVGKRLAFLAAQAGHDAGATVRSMWSVFGYKMRIEPFQNLAEKRVLFTPQFLILWNATCCAACCRAMVCLLISARMSAPTVSLPPPA
jgi:hypothetical protein